MATDIHRALKTERLDSRLMMTADLALPLPLPHATDIEATQPSPYIIEQATNNLDVDGNGFVQAEDALLIIDNLGVDDLPDDVFARMDVNEDGYVSPLDALLVINELHAEDNGAPQNVDSEASAYEYEEAAQPPTAPAFILPDSCPHVHDIIANLGNNTLVDDVFALSDVNQDGSVSPLDALLAINNVEGEYAAEATFRLKAGPGGRGRFPLTEDADGNGEAGDDLMDHLGRNRVADKDV